MAVFAHTHDVHSVIGTFSDGRKLVYSYIPVESADVGLTQVTIMPLKHVISFIPTFLTNVAGVDTGVFAAGTNLNQVGITFGAGANGAIIGILSVGV